MGKAKTSKFIRKYGLTLWELAEKYNTTKYYITVLDLKDELQDFIKQHELTPTK